MLRFRPPLTLHAVTSDPEREAAPEICGQSTDAD
jgi:hypothetical protein